jgi:hypothetical protein
VRAKAQIFLSYARPDEERVAQLYQKLSDAGFKPWMDTQDILAGENWRLSIQRAVRDSDFFLACLSSHSVNRRGFLQREFKEALDIWQEQLDSDIYLVPVRLEECQTPESLRDFQWVDLFEADGWSRLVRALQIGMRRRVGATAPAQGSEEVSGSAPGFRVKAKSGRTRTVPPRTTSRSFPDFLLAPPRGWAGVVSWLGVGVAGNLVAGVITLVWGTSTWQVGVWLLSIMVLLGGIYLAWRRVEPLVLVPENQRPAKHRGLIVLVGTGRPNEDPMRQSAWDAIEYHMSAGHEPGLETCWLVASGGETGSLPIAQKLKEACEVRNVTAHIRAVSDPFSVQESYDLMQRIYEEEIPRAGLNEQEVIADFTGGVKPMSAGMILSCGDRRPMQYMTGRKEGIASTPRLVEFTPRGRQRH